MNGRIDSQDDRHTVLVLTGLIIGAIAFAATLVGALRPDIALRLLGRVLPGWPWR